MGNPASISSGAGAVPLYRSSRCPRALVARQCRWIVYSRRAWLVDNTNDPRLVFESSFNSPYSLSSFASGDIRCWLSRDR